MEVESTLFQAGLDQDRWPICPESSIPVNSTYKYPMDDKNFDMAEVAQCRNQIRIMSVFTKYRN
jgi:hypothetical protein